MKKLNNYGPHLGGSVLFLTSTLNSLSHLNRNIQNIVVGEQIERQNLYFYSCTRLEEATAGSAVSWVNGAIWVSFFAPGYGFGSYLLL